MSVPSVFRREKGQSAQKFHNGSYAIRYNITLFALDCYAEFAALKSQHQQLRQQSALKEPSCDTSGMREKPDAVTC